MYIILSSRQVCVYLHSGGYIIIEHHCELIVNINQWVAACIHMHCHGFQIEDHEFFNYIVNHDISINAVMNQGNIAIYN